MPLDKSLLALETQLDRTNLSALPYLRLPSSARLPEEDKAEDLQNLATTLLSGSADAGKLEELSSKLKGFITVTPEPGLCIKMKDKNGKKIFVNICVSVKVPPLPKDVNDEELAEALQKAEESFRVPMSIGDPHAEADHSGQQCMAYDVAVNPSLLKKINSSELFYHFFLSLTMEALDEKYGLSIDRTSAVILKGKKVFGQIMEQRIRTKPKLITEVDGSNITPLSDPAKEFYNTPQFELWLDPKEVSKRCLTAEIQLPFASDLSQLQLKVADNKLLLTSSRLKPNYRLGIVLPVDIQSSLVDASFSKSTKTLLVTAPVKSVKETAG